MNELTEKAWPAVRLLLLPYLALLFLLFYPIEYNIIAPGGLTEVSETIVIPYHEDKAVAGSISTTFVISMERSTFFMFVTGYFNPYLTIYTATSTYTPAESQQIAYLDKATSIDASIIVAYQAAATINPEVVLGYVQKTLVFGKASYLSAYDEIAFGDEFVQVLGDGGSIATSIEDIASVTALASAYDFTFRDAAGADYVVTLVKDAETGRFGLTLKVYHLVDRAATYPLYDTPASAIGGPSGGLMQALYVYNQLIDEDITHGLRIAGTGTIGYDGVAGYIGGVGQKVVTAFYNGAQVFFVPCHNDGTDPDYAANHPSDNYIEALRACAEFGIDPEGWLIPVYSLADVIAYLDGLGA